MSYAGAAVVPHSPLLLSIIAKEHAMLGDRARSAMHEVAVHIHTTKATDLIILTPHGVALQNQLVLLGGDTINGDLKDFGDLTKTTLTPSASYIQTIRDRCETEGVTAVIQSQHELDYGVIVPWRLLELPNQTRVTVLSVAAMESDQLIRLGRVLHDVAVESAHPTVILASADLSRRRQATERHDRPTPQERQIAHALQSRKVADLPSLTSHAICGLAPIFVLLSSLEGRIGESEIIATEAPYGVGYITAWLTV